MNKVYKNWKLKSDSILEFYLNWSFNFCLDWTITETVFRVNITEIGRYWKIDAILERRIGSDKIDCYLTQCLDQRNRERIGNN